MILVIEKGTIGWICLAIHWYAQSNNKYIKDYHKS